LTSDSKQATITSKNPGLGHTLGVLPSTKPKGGKRAKNQKREANSTRPVFSGTAKGWSGGKKKSSKTDKGPRRTTASGKVMPAIHRNATGGTKLGPVAKNSALGSVKKR